MQFDIADDFFVAFLTAMQQRKKKIKRLFLAQVAMRC